MRVALLMTNIAARAPFHFSLTAVGVDPSNPNWIYTSTVRTPFASLGERRGTGGVLATEPGRAAEIFRENDRAFAVNPGGSLKAPGVNPEAKGDSFRVAAASIEGTNCSKG